MNAGDTAFILLCAAFVFIMTPGLAFFYGGMVRRKNVGNTMMQCVFIMGVSVVMWVLVGYALSFGGNHAGIIGGAKWFGFNGVGMKPGPYAATHSQPCIRSISDDVCNDHTSTDHRILLQEELKFKALVLLLSYGH